VKLAAGEPDNETKGIVMLLAQFHTDGGARGS
jgi:hypothetical protein